MIKKRILLATFLAFTSLGFSQEKTFTVEEATFWYQSYPTQRIIAPQWRNNSEFTSLSRDYQSLIAQSYNQKNGEVLPIISKGDVEKALKEALPEENFNLHIFPYDYQWKNSETLQFSVEGSQKKYIVELYINEKKITKTVGIPLDAKEEEASEDLSFVVWVNGNDLMISYANGTTETIASDENIINGSSNVHRNEFGIKKGFWISPDQQQILYYSKDETMVSEYPLIDFSGRVATETPIRYPMAGMKSEEVKLRVYHLNNKKTVTLAIDGPKEQFLTMPTFTPDSKSVLVGVLNREQNELKVQRYQTNNGKLQNTLFTQTDAAYVEPSHDFKFIPNSDNFIYITDRDGYRNMELYNLKGKKLKTFQYKDVVFKDFVGIDKNDIYYIGAANLGMDQLLYKANIKTGKTVQLSNEPGIHTVKNNGDFSLFYDEFTNSTTPNKVEIINSKGADVRDILVAENPYKNVNMPKVEYVKIKATDNRTDLNGRLIYPINFDENKKYPVMVYVYGGPHAQLVNDSYGYGASGFDYYMAQHGFVVFTLDNRGSENRSKDFEQVIHRHLGQNEMKDQMKGVEFLKSKPFIDTEKIGVYGWSFGGFMTTSLMLNYPETFKVGVAGGPVIDWKWYEVMYGERYMDMPQENPEGYEETSLIDKAKNLKGRLLIIHGAQDPVVVQQHSMEFIEACIEANVPIDYFLYPTHEHNVRGKDRVHLNTKIADYFMTHLK